VTLAGEPVEFEAEGLLARIMQHECDHLDGTLFIDRLSEDARREVMRQLREQELQDPAQRARLGRGW
jgi:peptide deformylase